MKEVAMLDGEKGIAHNFRKFPFVGLRRFSMFWFYYYIPVSERLALTALMGRPKPFETDLRTYAHPWPSTFVLELNNSRE